MTPKLKVKITRARTSLATDPMGIVAGIVHPPAIFVPMDPFSQWKSYREFLCEVDGGRFGSIDVWSLNEYTNKQYPAVDFPGGQQRWLIIGQLLYEPIALEADTGQLHLFRRGDNDSEETLGDFDEFFEEVVFGSRYIEVVADGYQDEWWVQLEKAGLR